MFVFWWFFGCVCVWWLNCYVIFDVLWLCVFDSLFFLFDWFDVDFVCLCEMVMFFIVEKEFIIVYDLLFIDDMVISVVV